MISNNNINDKNGNLDLSMAIFITTMVTDLVAREKPPLFIDGVHSNYEQLCSAYGSRAIKIRLLIQVKRKVGEKWVLIAKKTENL